MRTKGSDTGGWAKGQARDLRRRRTLNKIHGIIIGFLEVNTTATVQMLAAACSINRDRARFALNRLQAEGKLVKTGRGKGAKWSLPLPLEMTDDEKRLALGKYNYLLTSSGIATTNRLARLRGVRAKIAARLAYVDSVIIRLERDTDLFDAEFGKQQLEERDGDDTESHAAERDGAGGSGETEAG